jgi:hypothetical protein
MAAQIEVPKVVQYVATGSDSNEASASKVVAYLILVPGEIEAGEDTSNRQGHVHTQIIRRD